MRGLSLFMAGIMAGLLLASPCTAHAANPYMAEMDILEYTGGKIEPVPDISLPALNGHSVNLKDLKGRVLLLVFWTST